MASVLDELHNSQTSTAINQYKERQQTGAKQELDQDAFLMLMMEQLKQQDPTNPMDNSQMLTQQAQFTQISELQKLNSTMTQNNMIMQASSLIGKTVTVVDPNDTSKTITGVVDSANFTSSTATLTIDGKEYPLGLVTSVGTEASQGTGTPTPDTEIADKKISDLNNAKISSGNITLQVIDENNHVTNHVINITQGMTVGELAKKLTVNGAKAGVKDGKLVIEPSDDKHSIKVVKGDYTNAKNPSSDFISSAGLTENQNTHTYTTNVLDFQKNTSK